MIDLNRTPYARDLIAPIRVGLDHNGLPWREYACGTVAQTVEFKVFDPNEEVPQSFFDSLRKQ